MAEYTFWAIRENDVSWGYKDPLSEGNGDGSGFSPASSFTINDTSKFFQVTLSDDDLNLEDYARYFDTNQVWVSPDIPLNEGGNGSYQNSVWALAYKKVDAFPEGGIYKFGDQAVDDNYGFITFSGLQPGDIQEGETYHLTSVPGGIYTDDSNGTAPPVEYSDLYVNCFTSSTLIKTSEGNKPVEDLRAGDLIATMDDGYQPIRWIGSTKCDAIDLAHRLNLKPVRIPAGALGGGLPKRDLTVSRQHRVLVRSKIAQRMFGAEEILIPAIKLVGLNEIEVVEECNEVTYVHILFDKHQVIFSEDAPTESLFIGPVALQGISPEARKEIETLFPEITALDFVPESARLVPAKGTQIKQLLKRHEKCGVPLLNNGLNVA